MLVKSAAKIAMLLTVALHAGASMAADWKPVELPAGSDSAKAGSGNIEIDRSRIGFGGGGLVSVWSRLGMPQAVADADGRYNRIEALNRYACGGNRFTTMKRLYLLDNTLVRVEPVLTPRDMAIVPGSMEAAILADVCKAAAQMPAIADHAVLQLPAADTELPHFIAVSDAVAVSSGAPPPPAGLRRFIALPRIDPSQVQHPTDEVKPADAAKESAKNPAPEKVADPAAIKREAAKAGVSLEPALSGLNRHAREMALATSGPRRKAASTRAAPKPQAAAEEMHRDIHWDYEGDGAPANWGKLRTEYAQCGAGQRQSPIDIREGIRVDLEPIRFDYHPSSFRIIDNGHTIQVNLGEGNSISVMGRTWRLVQLHFHRPSEERIDGRGFDMVMHMVHKDDEGHLAVVAVLIERGAEQPVIQTFWNNLPLETGVELAPATAVDPNKLLPELRSYYTYMGSLTTPPCTEGVLWMVLKQPLQLSAEQIAIFSRLYKNNARPIQASAGRLIKESR